MEFLRRPTVLAAIAAGLFAINVVYLVATDDGVDGPIVADERGTPTDDATGPTDGGEPDDGATSSDAATGGAADGTDGDGAQEQPTSDDADGAVLTAPIAGTYTYASSGSWSYDDGTPEEHQLPATAAVTVTGSGDQWSMRLDAGQMYADEFTFVLGADGGLDWDVWVLERTIDGSPTTTTYTCAADTAFYRPDGDAGRTLTHVCETPQGSVSTGSVEVVGTEEITLGDGTVVAADHIVYRTTDSSTSDDFEVKGEGRIDLWLDRSTGLRVREQRSSQTVTTSGGQDFVYREEVQFLLQSATPEG